VQSSSMSDTSRLRTDCAVHMRWALLLQDTLRQVQRQREAEETLCRQQLAENKKLRQHLREREPHHPLLGDKVEKADAPSDEHGGGCSSANGETHSLACCLPRLAATQGDQMPSSSTMPHQQAHALLNTPNLRTLSSFLQRDEDDSSEPSQLAPLQRPERVAHAHAAPEARLEPIPKKFQRSEPFSSARLQKTGKLSAFDALCSSARPKK